MSAGRPSLYREEYAERVIEFCRDGYTLTAFAGEIGVARSTINEWIDAHPDSPQSSAIREVMDRHKRAPGQAHKPPQSH